MGVKKRRLSPVFVAQGGGMKMDRRPLAVILAVTVTAKLWGGEGADTDIRVSIPPELDPEPTREEKARETAWRELSRRANAGLPYLGMDDQMESKAFFTLGRAVEHCSNIAVVSVLSCEYLPLTEKLRVLRLRFNVESNLFGRTQSPGTLDVPWAFSRMTREQAENLKKRGINVTWKSEPATPETGGRLLLFLSPENQSKFQEFWHWDNSWRNKPSPQSASSLYAFGDAYNVVSLDGKSQGNAFLAAVLGYVKHLRSGKVDAEKYYPFLKEQMKSPIPRLKEDARCEMVNLLRSSAADLGQAASDEEIDDGIKKYVRLILIPERQKREQQNPE
jgi:hypothetical protein